MGDINAKNANKFAVVIVISSKLDPRPPGFVLPLDIALWNIAVWHLYVLPSAAEDRVIRSDGARAVGRWEGSCKTYVKVKNQRHPEPAR